MSRLSPTILKDGYADVHSYCFSTPRKSTSVASELVEFTDSEVSDENSGADILSSPSDDELWLLEELLS